MKKPKSILFYDGPSQIDGSRILAIATGLFSHTVAASQNIKTGPMVQTWIIRADLTPTAALQSGDDASVCGACPLRPLVTRGTGRPRCYVNVGKGLQNIYLSWQIGNIPAYTPEDAAPLLAGRKVRLGAYGDPAALPLSVWESLLSQCAGSIGYTHQWRTAQDGFSRLCLASVETPCLREEAHALGYRTYRVDVCRTGQKLPGETRCPGSEEAGKKLTCAECMACDGHLRNLKGDIVIMPHGVHHGPRIPLTAPARRVLALTEPEKIRAQVQAYVTRCMVNRVPIRIDDLRAIAALSLSEIHRLLQEAMPDPKEIMKERQKVSQANRQNREREAIL